MNSALTIGSYCMRLDPFPKMLLYRYCLICNSRSITIPILLLLLRTKITFWQSLDPSIYRMQNILSRQTRVRNGNPFFHLSPIRSRHNSHDPTHIPKYRPELFPHRPINRGVEVLARFHLLGQGPAPLPNRTVRHLLMRFQ